jgi:glycosyltransferase involved in cell wall biosynthesis
MRIAFYYHIPISFINEHMMCPSYLGVFIDSLAREVDELYLFMHQANVNEISEADYTLEEENIHWINLGLKTPVWHRAIFHRRLLKKPLKRISTCNALIVRSPSPLAPYFNKYLKTTKLIYMVVGDYLESVEQRKAKSIRERIEFLYLRYNDFLFRRAIRKTDLMVNSPELFIKYHTLARSIQQIRTTTVSSDDFFIRSDTCQDKLIELLFTGRIDTLKGLFELIEAVRIIKDENFNVRLNIVGWEADNKRPVERTLKQKISSLGLDDSVQFHGRKAVGPELNYFYRMSDIYVLPSYEEGFPRTIWEAMANSLPVIATNVGGIPSCLTHRENAFLIEPRRVDLLTDAIKTLISDKSLRQRLIIKGREIAQGNTLEIQAKRIIEITKKLSVC